MTRVARRSRPARPAPKKRVAKTASAGPGTNPAVSEFMRKLDHPLKDSIEEVRRIVLGISPRIGEVVKWNAPTFREKDDFATVFLRDRKRVRLLFHLGAKVKDGTKPMKIEDPGGIVEWLAKDRCLVTVGAPEEIRKRRKAFEAIVRAWIRQL